MDASDPKPRTLKVVEDGRKPEAGTTFRRRAGYKFRSNYNWGVDRVCLHGARRKGEQPQASVGEVDEAVSDS